MRHLALDLDKKTAFVTCMDGDQRQQYRIALDPISLNQFKASLRADDQVCMEACPGSYYLASFLLPAVARVGLVDPIIFGQIIDYYRHKIDRNDSGLLCNLHMAGVLPIVWLPDKDTWAERVAANHRKSLDRDVTRYRNRVHALLTESGLGYRAEELIKKETPLLLNAVASHLPESALESLASMLKQLDVARNELKEMTARLVSRNARREEVAILVTVPGLDTLLATHCLAAIGTIDRFKSAPALGNYSGLTPTLNSSGPGKPKHGGITKRGSALLRWAVIEAANNAIKTPGRFKDMYQRLRRKGKNPHVAIVTVARELLEVIWHLLTKKEPYRDLPAASKQRKERRREQKLKLA